MQSSQHLDAVCGDKGPHVALIRDPVSNSPLVRDSEALGFAPRLQVSPAARRWHIPDQEPRGVLAVRASKLLVHGADEDLGLNQVLRR
jgi:hypothetical protein